MPMWQLIAFASGCIIGELVFIEICVAKARNHFGMSPRVMSTGTRRAVIATGLGALGVAGLVYRQIPELSAGINLGVGILLGLEALMLLVTCRDSLDVYRNALRTAYVQQVKRARL